MLVVVPDFKEIHNQLVFLAGPIQGAEDWQKTAIEIIQKKSPSLNIATPRGDYSNKKFDYDIQVDWESYHLSLASESGGILFWLAKEKEHFCHRAYAQTTRFELAEWITKYTFNKGIKLFIGIESGFSGERYLKKRIEQDCPEITIHSSLEDVCEELIQKTV
ncbi:MAG: hypothetical protein UT05_C0005G0026 [Parcubacteria group bacterium GW2011_GWF2_38_76]|nr:MAG: hypothetical protein UT05_C0005G0026 [Parcubacteria group bacterium GW2011_GWF2_38_76]HBM45596.1 hypothetical protein [Patescibacteria group bacterium]